MRFYNSTNLDQEMLTKAIRNAKAQDEKVLLFFQKHSDKKMSPCQVYRRLRTASPLTSIRRSINTLTAEGHLRKLDEKIRGMYGSPVHLWTLNNKK